jgi:hypothetical protein
MDFEIAVMDIFFAIRQLEQDFAVQAAWTHRVIQLCTYLGLIPGDKPDRFTHDELKATCLEIYNILSTLSSTVNRWPRLRDATWGAICDLYHGPAPPRLVRQ